MWDVINNYAIGAEYEGIWKHYKVYKPILDLPKGSKIGYPLRILKSNVRIRMTTHKESIEYLRYRRTL